MTKSKFAFRRSSPKSRALPDLISSRCLPPESISLKQSPLPLPPEPLDPPDPPDLHPPLKKRLGLYLVSAPLVYYCVIDHSSLPLGFVSPDRRVSPASLEVCPLPSTTTDCYCIKAHSPLSLGLISPDRKSPPMFLEAYLIPITAIYVTSPTLSLLKVVSSSPSDSPKLDLYQLREEFVEMGLKVRVSRLSLMDLMVCVPSCGSFTALVLVCDVYCRIFTDFPECYVAILEITSLCLQMGPISPVIVTLSGNLGPLDIRCPPLSAMELFLLPNTTLVYSGSMGSNLLKCVLLVAEAKMAAFSRLAFDDADDSTQTSLEVLSFPFWRLIQDHHGEDAFLPKDLSEFAVLVSSL